MGLLEAAVSVFLGFVLFVNFLCNVRQNIQMGSLSYKLHVYGDRFAPLFDFWPIQYALVIEYLNYLTVKLA